MFEAKIGRLREDCEASIERFMGSFCQAILATCSKKPTFQNYENGSGVS